MTSAAHSEHSGDQLAAVSQGFEGHKALSARGEFPLRHSKRVRRVPGTATSNQATGRTLLSACAPSPSRENFLYVFKPPCRAGARPEHAHGRLVRSARPTAQNDGRARAHEHGRTHEERGKFAHVDVSCQLLHPHDRRMIKAEPIAVNPAPRRSRQIRNLHTRGHCEYVVTVAGSVTGLTAIVPAMGG